MGLYRSSALIAFIISSSACGRTSEQDEITLRHCMGDHARALPGGQRPSFHEAITFARDCGALPKSATSRQKVTLNVDQDRIDTLACAYSRQWNRCGRETPTD